MFSRKQLAILTKAKIEISRGREPWGLLGGIICDRNPNYRRRRVELLMNELKRKHAPASGTKRWDWRQR